MAIRDEVMGHLSQMFDEIEEAVSLFPADLWERKDVDVMMRVPAFLAHHTIWCMRMSHLLDVPENEPPDNPVIGNYTRDNLPTKEALLAVLNGIRSYSDGVYGCMTDDAYLSKGEAPSEPIDRIIYAIAHTRQHLGEMVQILREHRIGPPTWYPR
jgi:hypothetical protein